MLTPRIQATAPLLLALPLAFAFHTPAEELDLTPRYEAGQTYTVSQVASFEMALDELSVMLDGTQVLGDGVDFEVSGEFTGTFTEEILELNEGTISKAHVTVDEMEGSVTGSADMMGESETIDETMEFDVVGHKIEITVDEDGEETAKDISEDLDQLPEDEVAMVTLDNHFELMLPEDPVEEGESFKLAEDWAETIEEVMATDMPDMSEEEAEMARVIVGAMLDSTTLEAVGKVTSVKDGMAAIEYTMSGEMMFDDLMGLMQQLAPEEMAEVPPGLEASMEMSTEMTGLGLYDLKLGQMTSLEFEGEFEIGMDGAADMNGTSGSAEVALSGTFTVEASLELE